MRRISAFLLFFLLGGASILSGQQPAEITPGARVRLVLLPDREADRAQPQELRGTVVAISGDSLTLQMHAAVASVTVPLGWVQRMHVSLGRTSAWEGAREGGTLGLLIGAGLGAMIGAEIAQATEEPFLQTVLIRAAAYGLSIGATTAILGALQPGERWRQVPVRAQALAMPASRAGVSLGASLSF